MFQILHYRRYRAALSPRSGNNTQAEVGNTVDSGCVKARSKTLLLTVVNSPGCLGYSDTGKLSTLNSNNYFGVRKSC